jgi:hypothetical protein
MPFVPFVVGPRNDGCPLAEGGGVVDIVIGKIQVEGFSLGFGVVGANPFELDRDSVSRPVEVTVPSQPP